MKKIYQSKTFWFNALTLITVFATVFGYAPNQELADTVSGALVLVAPLVNILLRVVTDTAIEK